MKKYPLLFVFILAACTPKVAETIPTSTPLVIDPPALQLPTPTIEINLPLRPSTDSLVLLSEAVIIDEDFEDQEYAQINDPDNLWSLETIGQSNTVLCNEISSDWGGIFFGQNDFENYTIKADIYFIEATDIPGFELYIRLGEDGGYRATLSDNSWAAMNWYGPNIDFGGSAFPVNANEKHTFRVQALDEEFTYFIDANHIVQFSDATGISGRAGVGASPGTKICVDNIQLWFIDASGYPIPRDQLQGFSNPNDPLAKYEGDCVFCFLNGSNVSMPIYEGLGWTYQEEDLREIIVLDETFSVAANSEATFENNIILVQPNARQNIEIFGTLIIKDSIILWDQTQHQQTRLSIMDGGRLEISSSYAFSTNNYWVNWDYEDGSTVILDNFVGSPWTATRGAVDYTAINYSTVKLTLLRETKNANIYIEDAHHVWLELYPPPGQFEFNLPTLQTWDDWNIDDVWEQTSLEVINSYIYERDIGISRDTHVTIIDAEDGFSLGWAIGHGSSNIIVCELSGLGDPQDNAGVVYANFTWVAACNNSSLTLINSRLKRAWPVIWGNTILRVYDSNLVDPRNFGGGETIYEIYDSTIDLIASYNGGQTYIENSPIKYDIEVKDAGSKIYYYNSTSSGGAVPFDIYEIDGGQMIFLNTPGPPWD